MRLTTDLVLKGYSRYNALKQRELVLRAHKIPAIENLGVTEDGYDCIVLNDNVITTLENFPSLPRLTHLHLANNRIKKIDSAVGSNLKHLKHLVLCNNRIASLKEIEALKSFEGLQFLSLNDNPVTSLPNYRLLVINALPTLKFLDFQKIGVSERKKASEIFEESVTAVTEVEVPESTEISEQEEESETIRTKPTEEETKYIRMAIQNASSAEEIDHIQGLVQGFKFEEIVAFVKGKL
eukprot:TRINITY_DN15_c0_g1_i1.p1 TRINITY_DN15_c0_g1~~TRINITY_DN15_c0_g1_i1.p1  ORF type:complete len:238 (+),score=42.90 TRINITY_DN15_c0_g1_i1:49-762(+)